MWQERTRWLARALIVAAAWCLSGAAHAGVMTRALLQERFPAPLTVGERDPQLPVWPVFKQDATTTRLVGYVFESIDLAPIPGFTGTPLNLLVALDAKGVFLDVQVLSQHEPVFLDGLGEEPLRRFVAQYRGLSLQQDIRIAAGRPRADARAGGTIDGIAKATASVRIVNQSLLAAALRVARARLGFAAGRDPDRLARVRRDTYAPMDWDALLRAGLVRRVRLTRGTVEQAFAGTGLEQAGEGAPEDTFTELYVAWLSAPAVGRNLLHDAGWQRLLASLDEGDHAFLVIGAGGYSFVGEGFVRGAVPERLVLRQGELPIELRDLDADDPLKLPPGLRQAEAKVFRVIGPAGLDPAQPLAFALRVTRSKGTLYAERVSRDLPVPYQLPPAQVRPPQADDKGWQAVWRARAWELGVLAGALGLLALVLARPAWLVADAKRLARFRTAYLLFTLLFIGWFAQGQLSIVTLTGVLQALVGGRDLAFLLYDPVSLSLWIFAAATLLAWGRGTFCGWLCPFGALQELAGQLAQALGVRRVRLRRDVDARLKWIKYVVLAAMLGTAAASAAWTDRIVEFEPFKTAITLNFVRAWPHVLWAAGLVIAGAFVHKAFCRYLCPLGAGFALAGRVRMLRWIPRRSECGAPCQTCRHRCDYQAIRPDGTIAYPECFQCLDCVAIHASDARCAPRLAGGRRRVFALRPEPALAAGPTGAAP